MVPVQIDSDNSEDENEDYQSQIKALPYSSNFSPQLKKLVASMQSCKFLLINGLLLEQEF